MWNVLWTVFREQSQESHTSVVLSNASFYRVHKLEVLAIWRWNSGPKTKARLIFLSDSGRLTTSIE